MEPISLKGVIVAITEQDQAKIAGAVRALFQERKVVSLDQTGEYLRSVVNLHLEQTDIEECIARLFEPRGANLPAIELHQAMLFRRSAMAYWLGQYAILVMEEQYIQPAEEEKDSKIRAHVYLFFGIAGDAEQIGKFLGAARSTQAILEYLKKEGIDVGNWHPLDPGQWKRFVSQSAEKIEGLVKTFGASLYAENVDPQQKLIAFAL